MHTFFTVEFIDCIVALQSKLREHSTKQNSKGPEDDILSRVLGKDRVCLGGPKTTRSEAIRMASQANKEVHEIKEKMVSMEKTCAQMAAQMATMMSMMSSMRRVPSPHEDFSDVVSSLSKPFEQGRSRDIQDLVQKLKRAPFLHIQYTYCALSPLS